MRCAAHVRGWGVSVNLRDGQDLQGLTEFMEWMRDRQVEKGIAY